MNMNGMLPAAGAVLQNPVLDCVPLNREANLIAIHELSVDLPLAIPSFEFKCPHYPRRTRGTGQVVKVRISSWVYAVVWHSRKIDNEPQHSVPLTRGQNIAGWATPIGLL